MSAEGFWAPGRPLRRLLSCGISKALFLEKSTAALLAHRKLWLVSSFKRLGDQTAIDWPCCGHRRVAEHAEEASAKFGVLAARWYD